MRVSASKVALAIDSMEMALFGWASYPYRNFIVLLTYISFVGKRLFKTYFGVIYLLAVFFAIGVMGIAGDEIALMHSVIIFGGLFLILSTQLLIVVKSYSYFRFVSIVIAVSLVLSLFQGFTANFWEAILPRAVFFDFRGPALQSEPSYLNTLVLLFYLLGILRPDFSRRHKLLVILTLPMFVVSTQSLSLLMLAPLYYLSLLSVRSSKLGILLLFGNIVICFIIAIWLFFDRINEALGSTDVDLLYFLTLGVSSWRSIPDFLILMNMETFLLPTFDHRIIGDLAQSIPYASFVRSTFSIFSTAALTLGLPVLVWLLVWCVVVCWRHHLGIARRITVFYALFYSLFFVMKFDPLGYVVIGSLLGNQYKTTFRGATRF